MKRLLLLSFLTVSVLGTVTAARVIEKPASLYQNTFGRLHIDAVTMTDKATILNLTVLKYEDVFFISRQTCLRSRRWAAIDWQ